MRNLSLSKRFQCGYPNGPPASIVTMDSSSSQGIKGNPHSQVPVLRIDEPRHPKTIQTCPCIKIYQNEIIMICTYTYINISLTQAICVSLSLSLWLLVNPDNHCGPHQQHSPRNSSNSMLHPKLRVQSSEFAGSRRSLHPEFLAFRCQDDLTSTSFAVSEGSPCYPTTASEEIDYTLRWWLQQILPVWHAKAACSLCFEHFYLESAMVFSERHLKG